MPSTISTQLAILRPINTSEYKYCIGSMYKKLTPEEKHQFNIQCAILRIARSTLSAYMKIKMDDTHDIPAQRLDLIAHILGVTPDDLKNYQVSTSVELSPPKTKKEKCKKAGVT